LTQSLQDIDDEEKEACQNTNNIVDIHITNEQKYCALELLAKKKKTIVLTNQRKYAFSFNKLG
jgi:hypothetical protein